MNRTVAALTAVAAVMVLNACSGPPETQAPVSSAAAPAPSTTSSAPSAASGETTAVTSTAGGRSFDATINDTQVSRDFLATLPDRVEMRIERA